ARRPRRRAERRRSGGRERLSVVGADQVGLLERVLRLDAPDRAGARAEDDRLGDRKSALEPDALEQGPRRDSRGGDEDVLAPDEIVRRQDLVDVVAGLLELPAIL